MTGAGFLAVAHLMGTLLACEAASGDAFDGNDHRAVCSEATETVYELAIQQGLSEETADAMHNVAYGACRERAKLFRTR